jgi:hypothetical protein
MDIPVQGQSQDYTIPLKVIFNIWSRFQLSTLKIIAWNVLTGCETSASRLPRFAIIQVNLERTGTRILVKGRTLASPHLCRQENKNQVMNLFLRCIAKPTGLLLFIVVFELFLKLIKDLSLQLTDSTLYSRTNS